MSDHFLIEFTKPKNPKIISNLIMKVQGSKYSHVRVKWTSSSGITLVYEASRSSVKFVGPISQNKHPVEVVRSYRIAVDPVEFRSLIDVCITYADVSYGSLQLIGMGLTRLLKLKKNPFGDDIKTQVCSELVSNILEKVKNWKHDMDMEVAGPKELDLFMASKVSEGLAELIIPKAAL
jgi:hypothetical protein